MIIRFNNQLPYFLYIQCGGEHDPHRQRSGSRSGDSVRESGADKVKLAPLPSLLANPLFSAQPPWGCTRLTIMTNLVMEKEKEGGADLAFCKADLTLDLIGQVHNGLSTRDLEEGRVILKFSLLSLSFNLIGQSQVFGKMMCNFKIRFGSYLVSFRLVHTSQPPAARQIGAFSPALDPRTGQHSSCLSHLQLKTVGKTTWEDVSRIHFQFQMSTSTTRLHFNKGGIVRI